jgi:SAM-dependent methyltransferase
MLALARTVVETFKSANEPVMVLRFDGTRRRGESHNDPECLLPGAEQHHFSFSQGVRDISGALDFLSSCGVSRTYLVSFSAASIEARRAVAVERARIAGWVSVVGAADLQSAMRTVSGGVDFLGGAERGVMFGTQEIQGVEVDIDLAASDALASGLAFMEDARRDMSRISVPVTWIHGRYDAWMDLRRTQALLGAGETAKRRLIVVPTGHQLRNSREALDVFQLIGTELVQFAVQRAVAPTLPDLADLRSRSDWERKRLPRVESRLRDFWRDYLIGRDGRLGIELMAATSAYRDLMREQIGALELETAQSVADLGCGTGGFLAVLVRENLAPLGLRIAEVDFIGEALRRIRTRYAADMRRAGMTPRFLLADLGSSTSHCAIPLADGSQDRVLASLLLSYVEDPSFLIQEIARIAKPGAIVVVSSLKPDADTSRIFADGAEELLAEGALEYLGEQADVGDIERSLRAFLNDAARLLDLEEKGVFRFWNEEELEGLLSAAGFRRIRVRPQFGSPPQALVVSCVRG